MAGTRTIIDADQLSRRLRPGGLEAVFHGPSEMSTLRELVRNHSNLVADSTRVMQRIKAVFQARAIPTPRVSVYRPSQRKQWLAKLCGGARVRAAWRNLLAIGIETWRRIRAARGVRETI